MSLTQRIARDSLVVTVLVILGRVFGFLIPLFIARWFGADASTDAWFLVLGIPLFVTSLLQTAIISTLTPSLARNQLDAPDSVPEFLGSTLLTFTVALSGLAGALALGVPPLLHLLAADRPDTAALAVDLFLPLLPVIPIAGLGLVFRSVTEVAQTFRIPALLPLVKGTVQLGLVALLRHRLGIHALPVALLLAEAAQLSGYALIARRHGLRLAWRWSLPPPLRAALRVIVPLLLGEAAVNLNVMVDKAFAARLGPGELSALEYADRVRLIPETALSAGMLTVVFAYWANQVAAGHVADVRQSFDRIARWLTLLLAPALVALALLRLEVIQLLFVGGRFDATAAGRTATVLLGYLPGFLPMMLAILAVKYLLVRGHVGVVVKTGMLSLALNIALDALLLGPLGTLGLSLATSLNQILVAGLLYRAIRRRTGDVLEARFRPWFAARTAGALGVGAVLELGLAGMSLDLWGRGAIVIGVLGGWGLLEAYRAGALFRFPPAAGT